MIIIVAARSILLSYEKKCFKYEMKTIYYIGRTVRTNDEKRYEPLGKYTKKL